MRLSCNNYILLRGGEIYTHMQKTGGFPESTTCFYASQVLLALEHLHQFNVIYRDIKPENILLGEDGYIAITDYGLAKFIAHG
jgi:serum/glucocorticoid-regulated kinase 2